MKTLAIILAIVLSACATATPETIAYRPNLDAVDNMRGGIPIVTGDIFNGLQDNPEVVLRNANTTEMSTTKFEPFTALAVPQQTDRYIQDVTITNLDATGAICLYLETWAQTCANAIAFTCLGSSLPGIVTPAGASRKVRVTGLKKICAAASESGVDGQLERTVLYAK